MLKSLEKTHEVTRHVKKTSQSSVKLRPHKPLYGSGAKNPPVFVHGIIYRCYQTCRMFN